MREAVVEVMLLDVPVALWAKTDALSRRVDEALARRDDEVARRLTEVLGRISRDYVTIGESAKSTLDTAAARGSELVDLAYPVPPSAAATFAELEEAYAAADADAKERGEDDLVWPAECVAFRRWYLGEIGKQIGGGYPAPWSGG